MPKYQLQLTEIRNGWLLSEPPSEGEVRAAKVSERMPQGTIVHCDGYEEVCAALKQYFPPK